MRCTNARVCNIKCFTTNNNNNDDVLVIRNVFPIKKAREHNNETAAAMAVADLRGSPGSSFFFDLFIDYCSVLPNSRPTTHCNNIYYTTTSTLGNNFYRNSNRPICRSVGRGRRPLHALRNPSSRRRRRRPPVFNSTLHAVPKHNHNNINDNCNTNNIITSRAWTVVDYILFCIHIRCHIIISYRKILRNRRAPYIRIRVLIFFFVLF